MIGEKKSEGAKTAEPLHPRALTGKALIFGLRHQPALPLPSDLYKNS